jgi:hypothetical protein
MKSLLLTLVLFLIAPLTAAAQNKYAGTRICAPCHRTEKQGAQQPIWAKTKHAEAYKTLTTAKANEIAKEKGLKTPAVESKECLECHTLGKTVDVALFEKTFDIKDGVQCESCHSAGSAYKAMNIMKDREKSIAAGMREFKDEKAIEAFCKTCHNDKSPTFKGFDFKERWDKIKHPVPKAG